MKEVVENIIGAISYVVGAFIITLLISSTWASCARAEGSPIPGQVQLQAVQQCIVETNQPAMCECVIDSISENFIKAGLSFPDVMPNEAQAQYLYQLAIGECQGLAIIQQAEEL